MAEADGRWHRVLMVIFPVVLVDLETKDWRPRHRSQASCGDQTRWGPDVSAVQIFMEKEESRGRLWRGQEVSVPCLCSILACEVWSRERERYWRMLSPALAIGVLGLPKLNRSIKNFDFLLSIELLRQTKSTIVRVNSAIEILAIKNDKNKIPY